MDAHSPYLPFPEGKHSIRVIFLVSHRLSLGGSDLWLEKRLHKLCPYLSSLPCDLPDYSEYIFCSPWSFKKRPAVTQRSLWKGGYGFLMLEDILTSLTWLSHCPSGSASPVFMLVYSFLSPQFLYLSLTWLSTWIRERGAFYWVL